MAFAMIVKVFNKRLSYRKKKVLSAVSYIYIYIYIYIIFISPKYQNTSQQRYKNQSSIGGDE